MRKIAWKMDEHVLNVDLLLFQHGNWRCVLESYCNKLKSYVNVEMINQERPYKVYDGKCLESCPADTEESVKGNKHTCEVRA